MLIVPSIDLSDGSVVRLAQGDPSRKTVYSSDPMSVALAYEDAGAALLHVVDLDGAFAGEPRSEAVIADLCARLTMPVQVAGGVRDLETVRRYRDLGAARIVIGTAAVHAPEILSAAILEHGEGAVVGALDAREGRIAVKGWVESGEPVEVVGRRFREAGLVRALHTDVSRDGVGSGPNLDASVALARATGIRITVSGGVSSLDDVRRVCECDEPLIEGLIIGRALYEGAVDLREACAIAQGV